MTAEQPMRYGLAEADWEIIKDEMFRILVELARQRQTISYSALAERLQTAYIHHRAPALHKMLRELCEEDLQLHRPMIGTLVVNKQTGRCGAGFFKWSAQVGFDVSDTEVFWQSEFKRVCDYWHTNQGEEK